MEIDYATLGDQEEYKLKNTVDRSNQVDGNTVSIGDYMTLTAKYSLFKMPLTLRKWIKRNLIVRILQNKSGLVY
jgi:hypothetical protein